MFGLRAVTRVARGAVARAVPARGLSAATPMVSSESTEGGVSILRMQFAPVNSMNTEFMTSLRNELATLEADKAVKAVVLTSGLPRAFCAGLDLQTLGTGDAEKLREFWTALQDLFLTAYPFKKPLVAAINASAPAGGCLLSLCADYRVMTAEPKATIGLNEAAFGIVAPTWFAVPFKNTLGPRLAEKYLQLGAMIPSAEALRVGLVDELVETDKVVEAARAQALKFAAIPSFARHQSKLTFRKEGLALLGDATLRQKDNDHFVNFITQAPIQKGIQAYLASLKKKA